MASAALTCCLVAGGGATFTLAPLPWANGVFFVQGLKQAVSVDLDEFGAPHIRAANREDAFAALGYVSARDRLFQMDLLRRKTAGRLSEVFGAGFVESDVWNRRMGFQRLAEAILTRLPGAQVDALRSFAAGVNQAMRDSWVWPIEFSLLRYSPQPWRPQDSLLIALNLADLSYSEDQERTATIMRAALPESVVDFLTPDSDCYNEVIAPRAPGRCSVDAIPADEIAGLMREAGGRRAASLFHDQRTPRGSNGWLVSGLKTRDGRAILANDMHLSLAIPNIWAQADLSYGDVRVEGLFLPGLPMIVSGSNGHVAWGMTSVEGDFSDLVRIRRDPSSTKLYFEANGRAAPLSERVERIDVRGEAPRDFVASDTSFGPLVEPLLSEDVAIRWTMLDPDATNLDLIEMDRMKSVEEALPLLRRAGTPPLNALVADHTGSIGWTLMGKIPKRRGFDGLFAEDWAGSDIGWEGFLEAEETPTRKDPTTGYLVNANQRMLPAAEFARKLGHDYSGGYRAYRIDRALSGMGKVSEGDMASLQLDSAAEPYRYYQQLAIEGLAGATDETGLEMKQALLAWDGRAETDSFGLPIIVEFRKTVVDAILSPILARCRRLAPSFSYGWTGADVPVRRLIDSGRSDLVPPPFADWRSFLRDALDRAADRLAKTHGRAAARLRWGDVSKVEISHPLSAALPSAVTLLDMPRAPMAGCMQCVRFYFAEDGKSTGANVRLVVSPGHESEGSIEMAGGQSGQFGSRHYADREADWVAGRPQKLRPSEVASRLELRPSTPAGK
jgi:penicillin amidase